MKVMFITLETFLICLWSQRLFCNLQDRVRNYHRLFMRAFSPDSASQEQDLLSYLLFDENFTAPLAELGHADAMAREQELVAFFSD